MKIIIFLLLASSYSWAFDSCLKDVKFQFENLSSHGRVISIKVRPGIFDKYSYTLRALNHLGIDNHFQGIQKLKGINNFVISGSDLPRKRGDLITINNAEIVKREIIGVWPHWHPGGIQLLGNILAIPVEEYKKSEIGKIFFFDYTEVSNSQKLPILIDIPQTKAGAVFFHRFWDGKYLVGSYNMSRIDFYFSNSTNLLDGFEKAPRFGIERKKFGLGGKPPFEFGAQVINLIPQCDGKLFIVLFQNNGKGAPIFSGEDQALLFSLDFNAKGDQVNLVAMKNFSCVKNCNFAAATGSFIDEQGKLFIYSSPHYLSKNQKHYEIKEFAEKK